MSADIIVAFILLFLSASYLIYYYGFKNRGKEFKLKKIELRKIREAFTKINKQIFNLISLVPKKSHSFTLKLKTNLSKLKKIGKALSPINEQFRKNIEKLKTIKWPSFKSPNFKKEEKDSRPTFLTKLLELKKAQKEEEKIEPISPREPKISEEVFLQVEKRWLNEVVKNPKNIKAYKSLARLYYLHGDYVESKEALETLIKLGAKDSFVKELKQKLERVNK